MAPPRRVRDRILTATLRAGAVLSLTGRYQEFGTQAARALRLWAEWDAGVVVEVVDDEGVTDRAAQATHELGARVDLLLGPYSSLLAGAAARSVREDGYLLWNHGGSGSHVEREFPGHVVSILTPTTRYAEPFLDRFRAGGPSPPLWIAEGKGRFARQVARAAEAGCDHAGVEHRRVAATDLVRGPAVPAPWSLFSAGSLEEDAEVANWATGRAWPPRVMCAVGAGVHRFQELVRRHDGVLGVAQWVADADRGPGAALGPAAEEFLGAYRGRWGEPLDYPGVQAVAGAVIATHCARTAGQTDRQSLWRAAGRLRTSTMFGAFAIDPDSGEQVAHRMVLVRWSGDRLGAV